MPMPRFAAIDMGSNACRLLVVEAVGPGEIRTVLERREPVRLGHGVFLTGRLDPESIEQAVLALRGFHLDLEELEVEKVRAVVTASARDAENARALLDRARLEAGIELEAIDGGEEARLVRLAVAEKVALSGKQALLVDLGGGSLELTHLDRGKVRFSESLEIGTVRLLESFLDDGRPVKPRQETLLLEYLERMLGRVAPRLARRRFDLLVATGGNFEAIAQLCPARTRAGRAIRVSAANALLPELARVTAAERRARFGLKKDRADVIVPALYVLRSLAALVRARTVIVPGVGLKEGIAAELAGKHFRTFDWTRADRAVVDAALGLGRKFAFEEPHATQVARLALELFDGLKGVHGLRAQDRMFLEVAALLHDVGDCVQHASHHKHSQYLIENSDIMGLSSQQRKLVGAVARYHRRALPSVKHEAFRVLSPLDRTRVKRLSALLRVADALDRGHHGRVKKVQVRAGEREVLLRVHGREDVSLELWTLARKAGFFEEVFGRRLVARNV